MLEKLKYTNHLNETLEFGNGKLFVNENDLRDFAWKITSQNNKISGFTKDIATKKLPIILKVDTEAEGIELRNKLFEVCERDVLAVKHGKITIGDYSLKCFITGNSKTDYLIDKGYMRINAVVTTDYPYWIKETTTKFYSIAEKEGTNLDYNRDFPSDYASNVLNNGLQNTNFVASNFILNIYGVCENPVVTIAGHRYGVNVSVGANEYITIDSVNQTVIKTLSDGSKENCFNKRNKKSYIFEKIPAGTSNISINSNFKFDVVLLEERSEPKWT